MKSLVAALAVGTAVLDIIDNWSTWICLRAPVLDSGDVLTEANPAARWIFHVLGLEVGLLLSYIITVYCLILIVRTEILRDWQKVVVLGFLCLLAGWAAWNNLGLIVELGLLAS